MGQKSRSITFNTVETLRLSGLRPTADGGHIGVGIEVGLILVGKRCDEPTIYRAAYPFEQSGDWKKM